MLVTILSKSVYNQFVGLTTYLEGCNNPFAMDGFYKYQPDTLVKTYLIYL